MSALDEKFKKLLAQQKLGWAGNHPQTGQIKTLPSGRQYKVRKDGAWIRQND